jgi:hypothetical protein
MRVPQSVGDPLERWSVATDEPLVLSAIERSDQTWLSAEAIAAESGLQVGRVQIVLDMTPADVIVAPAAGPGAPARYSTRGHYRATTSLLARYFDALVSS